MSKQPGRVSRRHTAPHCSEGQTEPSGVGLRGLHKRPDPAQEPVVLPAPTPATCRTPTSPLNSGQGCILGMASCRVWPQSGGGSCFQVSGRGHSKCALQRLGSILGDSGEWGLGAAQGQSTCLLCAALLHATAFRPHRPTGDGQLQTSPHRPRPGGDRHRLLRRRRSLRRTRTSQAPTFCPHFVLNASGCGRGPAGH